MPTPKILYIGILIDLDLKGPEIKFVCFLFVFVFVFSSPNANISYARGRVTPKIIN